MISDPLAVEGVAIFADGSSLARSSTVAIPFFRIWVRSIADTLNGVSTNFWLPMASNAARRPVTMISLPMVFSTGTLRSSLVCAPVEFVSVCCAISSVTLAVFPVSMVVGVCASAPKHTKMGDTTQHVVNRRTRYFRTIGRTI